MAMLRTSTHRLKGLRDAHILQTCARGYHKNVVDHFENPRNMGSFDKDSANVGTGLVGAPACGDVMKLQIRVDDDGNIVDSCFKTFGCGSAIASSSVVTEWVNVPLPPVVATVRGAASHAAEPSGHLSVNAG